MLCPTLFSSKVPLCVKKVYKQMHDIFLVFAFLQLANVAKLKTVAPANSLMLNVFFQHIRGNSKAYAKFYNVALGNMDMVRVTYCIRWRCQLRISGWVREVI
jgi:hypothetical protein